MKSSLPVLKRRTSTTAKEDSKEALQCRLPLPNRKSVLQGCSKKPSTELQKPTVGTKDLKTFEKQVPRAPSALTVKNRRFSTGSFSLNSNRKMDAKLKMAAFPKKSPLNTTYSLSRSDGKSTGQIILNTKGLDVVMVQRYLPNIGGVDTIPEQLAHFPLHLVEPSNLSPLLTSFVPEECFSIASELSSERKTSTVGAINPVYMTNVSLINDKPIPPDCSDTSPAKSLQFGCTSKLQENGLKDSSCQLIPTEAARKTKDSSVGAEMNNNYIESGTLPYFPLGNLLQLNETMMLSDHDEHKDDAPKHEAYSRNIPTGSNCNLPLCAVDSIHLDGAIVLSGASNMPSLCTKNDDSCRSAMPVKTLSNCKLPLSKRDLLLCEGAMLSDNKIVVPKHKDSFGNEHHEASALFDCMPSPFTKEVFQLNETITVRGDNATFDASKHESSVGNNLQAFTLSNCKLSLSTGDIVQINGMLTLDGHRNASFDISKHEGSLRNDTSKATALSSCKLSLSTGDVMQLNRTRIVTDCKDATFDALKHEDHLENDLHKTTNLPDCKLCQSSGGSNEILLLSTKNLKLVRKCEKRLSEVKQGSDGDLSYSAELHKGAPAVVKDLPLTEPSHNQQQNVCESADLVQDPLGSEWAPFCMSTPLSVALKWSYLPFDHTFQTSSSTLEDDTHECPHERVETKDDSRSSGTNATGTKSCSGKMVNAPRLKEGLQQTKISISHLNGARSKVINLKPKSEEHKCGAEKNSLPLPARTLRPDSSSVGRGGRPPAHPSSFSKLCLPKPSLVSGRPSSRFGTGQITGNNEQLPSCQTGVNSKMPPKAEPHQPLTKVITKIPGIKRRSPQTPSLPPPPRTKTAESKQVELFNLGVGGPPSVTKHAHKSLALASNNLVTGIKRPSSAMERKRLCSSPKRSKEVGGGTAKLPKKSGTKPALPLGSKPKGPLGLKLKMEVKGESPTSEPKVNRNKTAVEESKQELKVAKLQELAMEVAALELRNAALRQEMENPIPAPEETTSIDTIIKELEEKFAVLKLQNAALLQKKANPTHIPE
uniref:uncharacterized protein n=1 Tax=Pristiophorus japonicus TaxID=55135 RepID=UPI00398F49C2